MEISAEDVEKFLKDADKLVIKLPLFRGGDVAIDRAVGFVSSLEEAGVRIDVVIFSRNALSHEKVVPTEKRNTVAKVTQWVIDGLHLDYLPYTDVIIAMDKSSANTELVKRLCVRYGILDLNEITVKRK